MKIQISTIEKTCNVQVIELNAYLISKVVKAQVLLENAIGKKERTKWNNSTEKYDKVLDANGNPEYSYNKVDGELLDAKVLCILNELVEAFEQ